jgi:DNA-damage-inducible protein D
MKTDQVFTLAATFEGHAQQTEDGVEYWLARNLQHLLGYAKRDNFLNAVSKANTACEVSGHQVSDHFADVGKMVGMPKGAEKEISRKHITNNDAVRRTLLERGIRPESLTPAEDVKKAGRRLTSEEKQ